MRRLPLLFAAAILCVAVPETLAAVSQRVVLDLTNASHAHRSYQLVPLGHPCASGVVHENGWIQAGERRTETLRAPGNGRFRTLLCVDLRLPRVAGHRPLGRAR